MTKYEAEKRVCASDSPNFRTGCIRPGNGIFGTGDHLTAFAHEVQYELRDVATGDGDVLDRASDDIALSAGDDVRDTITRVDDRACQRPVRDAVRGPGRGEREHGLHGDVETLDIEGLEEDLGRLLAVLWRVERWLGLYVALRRNEYNEVSKGNRGRTRRK